jgi:hypothetical protein
MNRTLTFVRDGQIHPQPRGWRESFLKKLIDDCGLNQRSLACAGWGVQQYHTFGDDQIS